MSLGAYNGLGYIVAKRTYTRKFEERTEEWPETIARCINGAQEIGTGYTREGSVAEDAPYNAALLIDKGLVEGKAIKNHSGTYVSAALTTLTSAGHDFLDETEQHPSTSKGLAHSTMSIFISHSSRDAYLAERLVLKRHFVAYTSTDEEGFQFLLP